MNYLELKSIFSDYQYNKKLYDVIEKNLSGKIFDIPDKPNCKFEFLETSVVDIEIFQNWADENGSFYQNTSGFFNSYSKKLIKIPFRVTKYIGENKLIKKSVGNMYNELTILYIFAWMISDHYISIHQCYEDTNKPHYDGIGYKIIKSDVLDLADFIRNIKTPEKLVHIESFKFSLPIK